MTQILNRPEDFATAALAGFCSRQLAHGSPRQGRGRSRDRHARRQGRARRRRRLRALPGLCRLRRPGTRRRGGGRRRVRVALGAGSSARDAARTSGRRHRARVRQLRRRRDELRSGGGAAGGRWHRRADTGGDRRRRQRIRGQGRPAPGSRRRPHGVQDRRRRGRGRARHRDGRAARPARQCADHHLRRRLRRLHAAGRDQPAFTVPEGHMGVGLGIHGEPGIGEEAIMSAEQLGAFLAAKLLAERPAKRADALPWC